MEEIIKQINLHKENIKSLNLKIKNIKEQADLNNVQNEINKEQAIIITLYEIINNIKDKKESANNLKNTEETEIKKEDMIKKDKKIIKKEEENIKNKRKTESDIKETTAEKNNKKMKYKQINIENINPDKDNNFYFTHKNSDIKTKYYISLREKNNIYYYCSKKANGCKGFIKYSKLNKKWYIIRFCDNNIDHDTCTFNEYYRDFLDKKTSEYDMLKIKFQKFFVRAIYKANLSNNITINKK